MLHELRTLFKFTFFKFCMLTLPVYPIWKGVVAEAYTTRR